MDFIVSKKDLRVSAVDAEDDVSIKKGEILVDIDRFSLTSNNISYGSAGESLSYFQFFPHHDESQAKIPVWGVGQVSMSRCPGVLVGERLYGYFPMSRSVVLQPAKVEDHQFFDGVAHRRDLAPVYNTYSRLDSGMDPFYIPKNPHATDLMCLYRPLFLTSWLLSDFFMTNSSFGAKSIMLSSASSKTSYGLAFCLKNNPETAKMHLVGLTSAKNVDFVKSLGLYDVVHSYNEVTKIPAVPSVFVDMAGSKKLLRSIHEHFGKDLKYSCLVGQTNWEDAGPKDKTLPGPTPTFFFAPKQAQIRTKEVGPEKFFGMVQNDWKGFLKAVEKGNWCKITHSEGPENVQKVYDIMINTSPDPLIGHILTLWDSSSKRASSRM